MKNTELQQLVQDTLVKVLGFIDKYKDITNTLPPGLNKHITFHTERGNCKTLLYLFDLFLIVKELEIELRAMVRSNDLRIPLIPLTELFTLVVEERIHLAGIIGKDLTTHIE